jgi:MoaA/NifB/PqqE/SkfB family radical SAM enzyme
MNKSISESRRIKVHTGYTCNANCQFCYYLARIHEPILPEELLLEEIKLARRLNYEDIDFTGGEPTIVPYLDKLISTAKAVGFKDIAIITNGIRLADREYFIKLKEAGLNDVLFSLHGANSQIHDSLTRVPGSFNRITNAIGIARELGIKIRTNLTINNLNYTTLPEYAELVSKLGVYTVNFIFFNPWTTKNVELTKLMPKFSDVMPYLEKALDILEANKIPKVNIRYVPYCVFQEKYRKYICDFRDRVYDPDEWADPFQSFSEELASKISKELQNNKKTKIPNIYFAYYKFFVNKYIWTLRDNLRNSPNLLLPSLLAKNEAYQASSANYSDIKKSTCKTCIYFDRCDGIKKEYAALVGTDEFKPIR